MIFYGKANGSEMSVFPYTYSHLIQENPTSNFGSNYDFVSLFDTTDAYAEGFRIVEVMCPDSTPFDPATERCRLGAPVYSDGAWSVDWIVEKLPDDEREEMLAANWAGIRRERNRRLAETDWTQLPDAPVDASVWADYRQALRDITDQENPFNIVWPAEPGA